MIIGTFKDTGISGSSNMRSLNRFDTPSDAGTDDDDIVEVVPPPKTDAIGWAYVGSHNFTPSAWGNLSGSSFNPTLNVRLNCLSPMAQKLKNIISAIYRSRTLSLVCCFLFTQRTS